MRKMISSGVSLTLVCAGCISKRSDHRRDVDGDGYVSEQLAVRIAMMPIQRCIRCKMCRMMEWTRIVMIGLTSISS